MSAGAPEEGRPRVLLVSTTPYTTMQDPDATYAVGVSLKRCRLVLHTLLGVAVIAAITLALSRRGIVVTHYERSTKSVKQQEALLERYNSYSGMITAAVERPIELAASLLVQAMLLRVFTHHMLQAEPSRAAWVGRIALAAGVSYLLANGLSAVNVQVREQRVQSVIRPGDLVSSDSVNGSSSIYQSYAETQPGNPVTNTILRNLILPRASPLKALCTGSTVLDIEDTIRFGLPQRQWMASLLPTAVASDKTVRIDLLATKNPTRASPTDFPMDAVAAADLVYYSHLLQNISRFTTVPEDPLYVRQGAGPGAPAYGPVARVSGLLPPSNTSTESADRAWFLSHVGPKVLSWATDDQKNASLKSWTMELSRVQLSPSVWVDAVTTEREMAFSRLQTATSKDKSTTYLSADYPSIARLYNGHFYLPGSRRDRDSITLFGLCKSFSGADALEGIFGNATNLQCSDKSDASGLLLLSVGSRLVADAYVENGTIKANELVVEPPVNNQATGVLVNVREILTMTIARVSWAPRDLSKVFNAQCAEPQSGCLGLDMALPAVNKRLVLSTSRLPSEHVAKPIDWGAQRTLGVPLVTVTRPRELLTERKDIKPTHNPAYVLGDILMPHNIRNMTWRTIAKESVCNDYLLNRMESVVNNHMYMESTLQATYTAAAFFLLQDAAEYDVITDPLDREPMLAFPGNTQRVDVYVYIPWTNVLLTLTGCGMLVLMLAVLLMWPVFMENKEDPLQRVTDAHTMARVMLDSSAFPSVVVARSVVPVGTNAKTEADDSDADRFRIQSLALERKTERNENVV